MYCKPGKSLDMQNILLAFLVHLNSPYFLSAVCTGFVIEHRIPDDLNIEFIRSPDQIQKLFFAAPFRASSTVALEFSKIPKIIQVVLIENEERISSCLRSRC